MANKYLNDTGLSYFYNRLKTVFQQQETGKGLSTNDYTTAEKTKLEGVATGAEVNQNAFSTVSVYSPTTYGGTASVTVLEADSKTDILNLAAGDNIILEPQQSSDNVTIHAFAPTKTSELTNDSGFITAGDIPEGAAASSTTPLMDGTATTGTELAFARGDHVHPSDTSRVPITRTVNGHVLSTNITLVPKDLGIAFGTCSTSSDTAAKVVSISGYTSQIFSIVAIRFDYAVTTSNTTLNINNTGAFPITAHGGTTLYDAIKAGDTGLFMRSGTTYLLLAVDRVVLDIFNKADKTNPSFFGVPTAPTAAEGTNTTQIATTEFVNTAITAAVGDITGIEFEVVQELPATGEAGVIYLLSNGGSSGNSYDEYIYVSNSFEKIGTTDVDLSNYMQFSDMASITTAEIDTLFA